MALSVDGWLETSFDFSITKELMPYAVKEIRDLVPRALKVIIFV